MIPAVISSLCIQQPRVPALPSTIITAVLVLASPSLSWVTEIFPSLQPSPIFQVLEEWFSLKHKTPPPTATKTLSCNPLAAELSSSPSEQFLFFFLFLVTYYFHTPKSSWLTLFQLFSSSYLALLFLSFSSLEILKTTHPPPKKSSQVFQILYESLLLPSWRTLLLLLWSCHALKAQSARIVCAEHMPGSPGPSSHGANRAEECSPLSPDGPQLAWRGKPTANEAGLRWNFANPGWYYYSRTSQYSLLLSCFS